MEHDETTAVKQNVPKSRTKIQKLSANAWMCREHFIGPTPTRIIWEIFYRVKRNFEDSQQGWVERFPRSKRNCPDLMKESFTKYFTIQGAEKTKPKHPGLRYRDSVMTEVKFRLLKLFGLLTAITKRIPIKCTYIKRRIHINFNMFR